MSGAQGGDPPCVVAALVCSKGEHMSFFVTDKAAQAAGDVPLTYVDILYDHAGYLKTNNGLLGNGSLAGKAVGIVGAGAAGLSAAYLLMRMGARVAVFEESPRAGGRVYSLNPIPETPLSSKWERCACRHPSNCSNTSPASLACSLAGSFPIPARCLPKSSSRMKRSTGNQASRRRRNSMLSAGDGGTWPARLRRSVTT